MQQYRTKCEQLAVERANAIAAMVATALLMSGALYLYVITTYIPAFQDAKALYQIAIMLPFVCCVTGALYIIIFTIE